MESVHHYTFVRVSITIGTLEAYGLPGRTSPIYARFTRHAIDTFPLVLFSPKVFAFKPLLSLSFSALIRNLAYFHIGATPAPRYI